MIVGTYLLHWFLKPFCEYLLHLVQYWNIGAKLNQLLEIVFEMDSIELASNKLTKHAFAQAG
jgi:hypothetical protein